MVSWPVVSSSAVSSSKEFGSSSSPSVGEANLPRLDWVPLRAPDKGEPAVVCLRLNGRAPRENLGVSSEESALKRPLGLLFWLDLKPGVEPAKRVAGVVYERCGAIGVEAAEKRPLEGTLPDGGEKGGAEEWGSGLRRKRGGFGGPIVCGGRLLRVVYVSSFLASRSKEALNLG